MKKLFLVILAAVAVISSAIAFAADSSSAKVIAYYFHGSFRCPTCMNMEKYTKEAIDSNFKDALASGNLEFKVVNVEERGNEHFVNDYKLYTKTLILSMIKDGKEVKSKNLDKIWDLSRNKQKFIEYVTGEVNAFMKDAR
ncbi:MAG: nitrophenyl compound nitroreductase subunit ArsF family protein [Candidatus Omnitrophica bacterium]|nr:nitrophenyl compound nitroreductase subunit ArsF family protein [Candidatus Omnitrophota bacterium]MDD5512652.1 nitrophenyl compound nitroreductase subunit ArsF family protein [Candidatus Omnitrophota bacterium]